MRFKLIAALVLAACSTAAHGQDSSGPQNSGGEGLDRTIYLTNIDKAQDICQIAGAIRLVADIQSPSTDTSQRTLSVRATAEQVALAESF